MRILYFSANPGMTEDLELNRELRKVSDVLFWSITNGVVQLEAIPSVRRTDVFRYTATRKPQVLHYSGHGLTGELVLANEMFQEDEVNTEYLIQALTNRNIDVIVLNCCLSASLIEGLRGVAKVVIGCDKRVENNMAGDFSPAFYDNLQLGLSVREAFDRAVAPFKEHPYQISGDPAVLDAPLVGEPASRDRSEIREASEPTAPDAADSSPPEPQPGQVLARLKQRLDSVTSNLPRDIGWGLFKVLAAIGVGVAASWALRYAATKYLGWEMSEAEGKSGLEVLQLEWVVIALFLGGSAATRLVSDVMLYSRLPRAVLALHLASIATEESQRELLANEQLEHAIEQLESGRGE